MTKEDIREGVDNTLRHYLESVCSAVIGYKCNQKPKKCCDDGIKCPIIEKLLPDFKKDLAGKGVVIENKEEAIFHHGYFPKIESLI